MADVSKMVASRLKITGTVQSSIEVHGPEIADALTMLLFPDGAPEELTVHGFIEALDGLLTRSADDLRGADLAHSSELANDAAPRAARDESHAALRAQVIGIRGTFQNVFGQEVLREYGLADDTPADPDLLIQRARSTASLLRKRPLAETPVPDGVTIDLTKMADSLEEKAAVLTDSLKLVSREEREAQLTQNAKHKAMDLWNTTYQGTADTVTGLYELVGRSDLADRVRPTARRRSGLPEKQDEPTPE